MTTVEGAAAEVDVVVLGAGAGGMTAAAVAAAEGLSVLLLEKTGQVGGTTALSGGMVWLPANAKMAEAGIPDTPDQARLYLRHTVPGEAGAAAREAFLANAGRMLAFLEARTAVRLRPVVPYPDYYPDLPGATPGGRVLEPLPFDARELGADFALLRPPLPEFMLFGGMMVARPDIVHFRHLGRSWRSTARVARLVAAYAWQRLGGHPRGTTLVLGNALAARLLLSVRRLGVRLRLGVAAEELLLEGGRVVGVVVAEGGRRRVVRARRGVVLATGGFSHDPVLRARLLPPAAGPLSAASPGNAGDGIRLGLGAGGRLGEGAAGNAFWTPVSRLCRRDGSDGVFPHTVTDRGKPGLIAVNRAGRRFVNEAVSYHDFVRAMLRASGREGAAIPAWLVCDRDFLWRYGLGAVRPFTRSPAAHVASGYLKAGATLRALAAAAGIDAAGLEATVARYNEGARRGVDEEFGRGGDAYQRYLGDPERQPNPCVAPIERPPFYALAVHPGDLGTAAGLVTDAAGRVLGAGGEAVPGLYACGNDMASIMNGAYPGPGITLGPAMVFGFLCAQAMLGREA